MLDANQALSWIVFIRDKDKFEKKYPHLKIEVIEHLPWLSYILSGGVTRKSLIPKFLAPFIILIDNALAFLRPLCGLSWHIRIRKV